MTNYGKITLSWDLVNLLSQGAEIKIELPSYYVDVSSKQVTKIEFEENGGYDAVITYIDGTTTTISGMTDETDFHTYFVDAIIYGKITFTENDDYQNAITNELLDINVNVIILYHLNSPNITVTKSITWVATYPVAFNRPITYRNLMLDVKLGLNDAHFNYVYITTLKRYYFVTDMTLTNDWAQLTLHEDVLMSFDALIRSQTAFVERAVANGDPDVVDPLVTYDYNKNIQYLTLTDLLSLFTYSVGEFVYDSSHTACGTPDDFGFVMTVVRS